MSFASFTASASPTTGITAATGPKISSRTARSSFETGVLSINTNTSVRVQTPFGGFKQSGVGRELGPHALDAYTEVKSVFYATGG